MISNRNESTTFAMADTRSTDPLSISFAQQFNIILRLQRIFGLRPFFIDPSGSAEIPVATSPLGLFLYVLHGVLFVVCLIIKYDMALSWDIVSKEPMVLAQEAVIANILVIAYISWFITVVISRRMLTRIRSLFTAVDDHFGHIGVKSLPVQVKAIVKLGVIVFCFGQLLVFGYYLIILRPAIAVWIPDYFLQLVPHLSMKCCLWWYIFFLWQVNSIQKLLNRTLQTVVRMESMGPTVQQVRPAMFLDWTQSHQAICFRF